MITIYFLFIQFAIQTKLIKRCRASPLTRTLIYTVQEHAKAFNQSVIKGAAENQTE